MVSITAAAVFLTVGGLAAARGGRAEPPRSETRPDARPPAPGAAPSSRPLADRSSPPRRVTR